MTLINTVQPWVQLCIKAGASTRPLLQTAWRQLGKMAASKPPVKLPKGAWRAMFDDDDLKQQLHQEACEALADYEAEQQVSSGSALLLVRAHTFLERPQST